MIGALLGLLAARRPGEAGGESGKTLTFKGNATDDSGLTTYSFPGKAIGQAEASRRVIVAILASGGTATNATIDSVSVGGVSADIVIQQADANVTVGIAIAHIPTGTTAAIEFTMSGAKARAGIGWWTATGLTGNAAHDTASEAIGSPQQVVLGTRAGGFTIAVAGSQATTTGFTWIGATERYDEATESGSGWQSGADAATDGLSLQIDVTFDGGIAGTGEAMVAASW